jgi:hypothetical protein
MWSALQIALCYLNAAKSKVPNAIAEAKQGDGLKASEAALDKLFGSASTNNLGGEYQSSAVPAPSQTLISSLYLAEVDATASSGQFASSVSPCGIPSTPLSSISPAPAVVPVNADSVKPGGYTKRHRTPPVPVTPLPLYSRSEL